MEDVQRQRDIAQRVLMNEYKQLSKEKWTDIEVRHADMQR